MAAGAGAVEAPKRQLKLHHWKSMPKQRAGAEVGGEANDSSPRPHAEVAEAVVATAMASPLIHQAPSFPAQTARAHSSNSPYPLTSSYTTTTTTTKKTPPLHTTARSSPL